MVAVSCGLAACQETLRTALALGADRAILVETDADLQPLAVAKLLRAAGDEKPDLVILGEQAIDDDANQTARCSRPFSTGRRQHPIDVANGIATVKREVDGGLETVEVKLGDRDHRHPSPERAALRDAAEHHEGEEEAARHHHARGPRRHRRAPRLATLKVVEPAKRKGGGVGGQHEGAGRQARATKPRWLP